MCDLALQLLLAAVHPRKIGDFWRQASACTLLRFVCLSSDYHFHSFQVDPVPHCYSSSGLLHYPDLHVDRCIDLSTYSSWFPPYHSHPDLSFPIFLLYLHSFDWIPITQSSYFNYINNAEHLLLAHHALSNSPSCQHGIGYMPSRSFQVQARRGRRG